MLDNPNGSNPEEAEVKPTSELFYGSEPEGPTETEEAAAESEVEEAETEVDIDQSEEANEADEEVEVFDEPNEFAKYEYDPDSGLYEFKSMGKKVRVSEGQLIKNWQLSQKTERELESIANERKGVFDEAKQKELKTVQALAKDYEAKVAKLAELVSESEKTEEYWEELRDTDPSEYLRQKEIEQKRKDALKAAKEEQAQSKAAQRQQLTYQESQKMLEVIGDDWKDPEVRDKEFSEMQDTMMAYAITAEEMQHLLDHRVWVMCRDAMRWRKAQEKASQIKPVRKVPKTTKSSASPKKAEPKSTAELFYGSK